MFGREFHLFIFLFFFCFSSKAIHGRPSLHDNHESQLSIHCLRQSCADKSSKIKRQRSTSQVVAKERAPTEKLKNPDEDFINKNHKDKERPKDENTESDDSWIRPHPSISPSRFSTQFPSNAFMSFPPSMSSIPSSPSLVLTPPTQSPLTFPPSKSPSLPISSTPSFYHPSSFPSSLVSPSKIRSSDVIFTETLIPSTAPSLEENLFSIFIPVPKIITLTIPDFEIHIFIDSESIDTNILLKVTRSHMIEVFQNNIPEQNSLENLDLSFTKQRKLQRNDGIQETIFYFNGDVAFATNIGIDVNLVEELTKISFEDENLIAYVELLRKSEIEVSQLYATLSRVDDSKNESEMANSIFVSSTVSKPEGKKSGRVRLIASLSICGTIIVFFSFILMYHGKRTCVSDVDLNSEFDRPVTVVKYGDGKQRSWAKRLPTFGTENRMEIDEVSALSLDSSLCSTATANAWGTSRIALGSPDDDIDLDNVDEDYVMQPGNLLFGDEARDVNGYRVDDYDSR